MAMVVGLVGASFAHAPAPAEASWQCTFDNVWTTHNGYYTRMEVNNYNVYCSYMATRGKAFPPSGGAYWLSWVIRDTLNPGSQQVCSPSCGNPTLRYIGQGDYDLTK